MLLRLTHFLTLISTHFCLASLELDNLTLGKPNHANNNDNKYGKIPKAKP